MIQEIYTKTMHTDVLTRMPPMLKTVEDNHNFKTYVRPHTGELLEKLRLNIDYDFAYADFMEYQNEIGEWVRIFDFLGGYGSLIFGHNHPELVATANDILRSGRPFSSQASLRTYAARLGRKLSDMLKQRFQREYVSTFQNSGAEAVEAALKHATMSHVNRKQELLKAAEKKALKIRHRHKLHCPPLAAATIQRLQDLVPDQQHWTFQEAFREIRKHNQEHFLDAPPVFAALRKSYHGKTLGAVNLTARDLYRAPFAAMGPHTLFVDARSAQDFRDRVAEERIAYLVLTLNQKGEVVLEEQETCNLAALFIEPIQGEGGINALEADYLREIRQICDESNTALVIDEIQSGMGRTGTFLYSETLGVHADYFLMSKSLGGGLSKISALCVDRELYQDEFGMIHTSTFAEDDFSSAVALRALELLDEEPTLMAACRDKGQELKETLEKLQAKYPDVLQEIRGTGLMLGIEFADQGDWESPGLRGLASSGLTGYVIAGYLLHEHRIRVAPLLSNSRVIRLEPCAQVSEEARLQLYAALDRLCCILQRQNFYELVKFIVGLESSEMKDEVKDYRGTHFISPQGPVDCKVGFLMHFVDSISARDWDRSAENFTYAEMHQLLEICGPVMKPFYMIPKKVYSSTGKVVLFQGIGFALTSEMIQKHFKQRNMSPLVEKIEQGIEMALESGCELLGFGGYTSIIMQNCKSVRHDIPVTTGNSLTVAIGYEAILRAAADKGIDLTKSTFAVLGASGNIGSAYCELMAARVSRQILIGRPHREEALQALAANLYQQAFRQIQNREPGAEGLDHALARHILKTETVRELLANGVDTGLDLSDLGVRLLEGLNDELGKEAPLQISTDPADVKVADLILGTTNLAQPLIVPENLKPGPVVICDVAIPADTDPRVSEERPDVLVIQGGVVRVPPLPPSVPAQKHDLAKDWLVEGVPIMPEHVFACMGETMVLGLAGKTVNYSLGDVKTERVREILTLAKQQGFKLGQLKTNRSM